jgi:hypothetical protein
MKRPKAASKGQVSESGLVSPRRDRAADRSEKAMRFVNRLAWAAMVVGVTAAAGVAQQGSVITQGGQVTGGNLQSGGLGGVNTGGQGGQGGLGGGSGMGQGTSLQGLEPPPDITAPTGTGGAMNKSNVLGAWYANPYYSGTWDNSKSGAAPGGFAKALYPATNTGARGQAGLGGQAGRAGAQGGLGGLGGQRAGLNAANQSGTVIPMQVQIAYPAVPRFPAAPMSAPQLQADVSGMFARASATLPGAANVQVITNGNIVTLRGTVTDLDEARLIEGMTRLTPGVGLIRNELTFPVSQP